MKFSGAWKLKILRFFRILHVEIYMFFSIRVFFHGHWRLTGQQGKGGDHFLFPSTTSTRSRTFRHLFVILHVKCLSHIFNRNACIYQAATPWDLSPYRITIWLIDDVMLIFVLLLAYFILGFVSAIWHEKPVESNSQSTIILVLQANRLTKCAVDI